MAKKETTAMVETKNFAAAAMPDFAAADAGAGFENVDGESFAVPFLTILQKMSPEVDENQPGKFIPEARAGMFLNSVSRELYDGKDGAYLVPCAYIRKFILWGNRKAKGGGGFKGAFTPEQMEDIVKSGAVREELGKYFALDKDGKFDPDQSDYYSDTREHYMLTVNPTTGETSPVLLALSSTQVKSSKNLMTLLRAKKVKTPDGQKIAPTYASLVKATTVGKSNDKGSWSVIEFEIVGFTPSKDIFDEAKAFHKSIVGGAVGADYSKMDSDAGTGDVGEPATAEGF
jgi:hypothetical protein